jgi:hypothetical protein
MAVGRKECQRAHEELNVFRADGMTGITSMSSKCALLGDRMSCHALRPISSGCSCTTRAYVLMFVLRDELDPLSATHAGDTLRLRVLKVAAMLKISARRILLHFSAEHSAVSLFRCLGAALAHAYLRTLVQTQ